MTAQQNTDAIAKMVVHIDLLTDLINTHTTEMAEMADAIATLQLANALSTAPVDHTVVKNGYWNALRSGKNCCITLN